MKYFEINIESEEYKLADKIYSSKKAWCKKDVIADIEAAIGINPIDNVECNSNFLRMLHIPEGTRNQFKKKKFDGKYEALKYSELNKQYLQVIKKYNLINYSLLHFAIDTGLFDFIQSLYPIKTRYFIILKEWLYEEDIKKVKDKKFLTEVKESEYLKAKLELIKYNEDHERNV